MHPHPMLSLLKARLRDCRLVRMSSGDWCLVRDLGLVKGGKGLKHHDVVMAIGLRRLPLDALPIEALGRLLALPSAMRSAVGAWTSLRPVRLGSIRRAFQLW